MNKPIKYTVIFTSGLISGFALCKYAVNNILDELKKEQKYEYYYRRPKTTQYVSYKNMNYVPRNNYATVESTDEVIFNTRAEAQQILDHMIDVINDYGYVLVADFYDLADINCTFICNKYGWNNLNTADITKTRNGYCIKFPKPFPL